jgi:hypothetical protein
VEKNRKAMNKVNKVFKVNLVYKLIFYAAH